MNEPQESGKIDTAGIGQGPRSVFSAAGLDDGQHGLVPLFGRRFVRTGEILRNPALMLFHATSLACRARIFAYHPTRTMNSAGALRKIGRRPLPRGWNGLRAGRGRQAPSCATRSQAVNDPRESGIIDTGIRPGAGRVLSTVGLDDGQNGLAPLLALRFVRDGKLLHRTFLILVHRTSLIWPG